MFCNLLGNILTVGFAVAFLGLLSAYELVWCLVAHEHTSKTGDKHRMRVDVGQDNQGCFPAKGLVFQVQAGEC